MVRAVARVVRRRSPCCSDNPASQRPAFGGVTTDHYASDRTRSTEWTGAACRARARTAGNPGDSQASHRVCSARRPRLTRPGCRATHERCRCQRARRLRDRGGGPVLRRHDASGRLEHARAGHGRGGSPSTVVGGGPRALSTRSLSARIAREPPGLALPVSFASKSRRDRFRSRHAEGRDRCRGASAECPRASPFRTWVRRLR
jgi:hypothetical protein